MGKLTHEDRSFIPVRHESASPLITESVTGIIVQKLYSS